MVDLLLLRPLRDGGQRGGGGGGGGAPPGGPRGGGARGGPARGGRRQGGAAEPAAGPGGLELPEAGLPDHRGGRPGGAAPQRGEGLRPAPVEQPGAVRQLGHLQHGPAKHH